MSRSVGCTLIWLLIGILPAQDISPVAQEMTITRLIESLHGDPWPGAENNCNPACWDFKFTEPMKTLLKIGTPAQQPLINRLPDPAITDQVIVLLGGVGDERSVEPIIKAMQLASSDAPDWRKKILRAGNLALTNITVADVIWHHGGGIAIDACPNDPAECWSKWWERNGTTFRVSAIKQSRRYTNYPDYGIYRGLP